jgi:hypothetical protein
MTRAEYEKQEDDNWATYRELVRSGCSIPAHLLKYERLHKEDVRFMLGTLARRAP